MTDLLVMHLLTLGITQNSVVDEKAKSR